MKRITIVPSLLGLTCAIALLAALFILQVYTGEAGGKDGVLLAQPEAGATISPDRSSLVVAPRAASSAEIVERPLFAQSRRPAQPLLADAAPAPAPANLDLVLVGTILSATGNLALVSTAKDPGNAAVAEGESFSGWMIRAIDSEKIVVLGGGMSHEVALRDAVSAGKLPPVKAAQNTAAKPAAAARPAGAPGAAEPVRRGSIYRAK
jgi:hypothetical protein